MRYPNPAEVALYAKDGEHICSVEQYDDVNVSDHYVRLQPTVKDPKEVEPGEARAPEMLYVPWERVHMIRRDHTSDDEDSDQEQTALTSPKR